MKGKSPSYRKQQKKRHDSIPGIRPLFAFGDSEEQIAKSKSYKTRMERKGS
jgi:hypothetical protein